MKLFVHQGFLGLNDPGLTLKVVTVGQFDLPEPGSGHRAGAVPARNGKNDGPGVCPTCRCPPRDQASPQRRAAMISARGLPGRPALYSVFERDGEQDVQDGCVPPNPDGHSGESDDK